MMQSSNYCLTNEEYRETTFFEIPKGVKVLHANMISERIDRSSIKSILLPKSVEVINDEAFYACDLLQSINIPNRVTKIGKYAFSECKQLPSLTLPQTLKEIGTFSFSNCTSLQSIHIPNGVTKIGHHAFTCCKQLQSVTLPQSLKELECYSFAECTSLQSITIPNGVTTIGSGAFSECKQLRSVTLPQHLKEIKYYLFYKCKQLQFVIIPDSVTRIGKGAFAQCSALQIISIPKHTTIENGAFKSCHILNQMNPKSNMIVTNWLKHRFDDLPLHQFCYNIHNCNKADDKLLLPSSIPMNDKALIEKDSIGLTPLHVLCSNPSATPDMIKQLVSKNRNAAQVKNIVSMTPLHMYLKLHSTCCSVVGRTKLMIQQNGAEYDIHKMIDMGLEYKVLDVASILNGSCIGEELSKRNHVTGLYPFMTGAVSHQCRLVDVYRIAMADINNLKMNQTFSGKKRKRI